jgi:uncharacterized protein YutE (UPF0331/DUF86 family)
LPDADNVILERLKLLEDRLALLEHYSDQAASMNDYSTNDMLRDAVERSLQVAIEACLDIGRRLIALRGFDYADTNQRVFTILAREGIIPAEQLSVLTAMVGFRNIIVHDYADINNQTVYTILKTRLDAFRQYAQAIQLAL